MTLAASFKRAGGGRGQTAKMSEEKSYTPALGRHELTADYDRVIAVMTRERRWRGALLGVVDPQPGQIILDVGCGTGTFALQLKEACPDARVIGLDPDPKVLDLARGKAEAAGLHVDWRVGFGDELDKLPEHGSIATAVSSLVLHQCPLATKRAILAATAQALRPGGRIAIADYGRQRTLLMRLLFRQVQMLDGFENTQPNADGVLPDLMSEAGFTDLAERRVIPTPTGSISLLVGRKSNDR